MFDELSSKLSDTLRRLAGRGVLTAEAVREGLREVRRVLLEADVSFDLTREFLERVQARAVGAEALKAVRPGQQIVKIVHDELIQLLGERPVPLMVAPVGPTVILLAGLQGSGKTTTAAKLAASTQVTLVADTANEVTISINKHYEYSVMYEDIADILALNGMRGFYTKDAGYALAKRVDREMHKIGAILNGGSVAGATNLFEKAVIGGDGSTNFSGSANTNTGNGTALTDAGFRKMIQTLEDKM